MRQQCLGQWPQRKAAELVQVDSVEQRGIDQPAEVQTRDGESILSSVRKRGLATGCNLLGLKLTEDAGRPYPFPAGLSHSERVDARSGDIRRR